jgi:hypothetical protein
VDSGLEAPPLGTHDGAKDEANDGRARAELDAQLRRALLRELQRTWHGLNGSYFKWQLAPPTFELTETTQRLGLWNPTVRVLSVSSRLVLEKPWGTVVEVLKHEMAHQYVHEVLRCTDETPHGPTFRNVCRRMGIDARAAGFAADGEVADEVAASAEDDRILSRIAKLLALAESDSVNEAHAAMNAAQRLMLKYNLENADVADPREGRYAFRHLGKPTGRVSEAERLIAVILNEHFFVEVIWVPVYRALEGKRGSVLEICGTAANLEMASYVYSFLTHAGERLWVEHKKAQGIRGNRDRRTFIAGVMSGFYGKLKQQRAANRREGLVWVGDAELARYYRHRHPHIQRTRHTGNRRTEAHHHGREAGSKLVLHKPVRGRDGGRGLGPRGTTKLLGR